MADISVSQTAPASMALRKITTPILIHLLHGKLRFPTLFLMRCKLPVGRLKKRIRSEHLPDKIAFTRGGPDRCIADGKKECNFVWEVVGPSDVPA